MIEGGGHHEGRPQGARREGVSVGARSLGPGGATRGKAGIVSLGAGVIAVPVASMIYVGLAWMTVVAMTACVDASLMLCLAGPLVGTGLLFATTLALGGVVIAELALARPARIYRIALVRTLFEGMDGIEPLVRFAREHADAERVG